MEGDHIKVNYWLLPLSWLYGLVVSIRNLMFDVGMLKSKTFPLPVICVPCLSSALATSPWAEQVKHHIRSTLFECCQRSIKLQCSVEDTNANRKAMFLPPQQHP